MLQDSLDAASSYQIGKGGSRRLTGRWGTNGAWSETVIAVLRGGSDSWSKGQVSRKVICMPGSEHGAEDGKTHRMIGEWCIEQDHIAEGGFRQTCTLPETMT